MGVCLTETEDDGTKIYMKKAFSEAVDMDNDQIK